MGRCTKRCEKWVKMLQQGYVLENDSGAALLRWGFGKASVRR